MPERVMMSCGHASNAVMPDGSPTCAICIVNPDIPSVVATPDLSGRRAECAYCGAMEESYMDLPFFEYRPKLGHDSYYDGCRGWG